MAPPDRLHRRSWRLVLRLPLRGVENDLFASVLSMPGGGFSDPHAVPNRLGVPVYRPSVANHGRRRANAPRPFTCSYHAAQRSAQAEPPAPATTATARTRKMQTVLVIYPRIQGAR